MFTSVWSAFAPIVRFTAEWPLPTRHFTRLFTAFRLLIEELALDASCPVRQAVLAIKIPLTVFLVCDQTLEAAGLILLHRALGRSSHSIARVRLGGALTDRCHTRALGCCCGGACCAHPAFGWHPILSLAIFALHTVGKLTPLIVGVKGHFRTAPTCHLNDPVTTLIVSEITWEDTLTITAALGILQFWPDICTQQKPKGLSLSLSLGLQFFEYSGFWVFCKSFANFELDNYK